MKMKHIIAVYALASAGGRIVHGASARQDRIGTAKGR